MEYFLMANAALTILEKLTPMIEKEFKAGTIPTEEQQAMLDKVNKIRASLAGNGDAFEGPEFEQSGQN